MIILTDREMETAALLLACKKKLEKEGQAERLDNFLKNPKGAYKRIMLLTHPDKNGGPGSYDGHFKAVTNFKDMSEENQKKLREYLEDEGNHTKLLKIAELHKKEFDEKKEKEHAEKNKEERRHEEARERARQEKMKEDEQKKKEERARRAAKEESAKRSSLIFNGLLNKSIQAEYLESLQKGNWAQSVYTYKDKRTLQTDLIDDIKQQLIKDKKSQKLSDFEEAQILYASMAMLKKDLEGEFRWTRWLGTKSRLESIINKDMKALAEAYPDVAHSAEEKLHQFAKTHPKLKIRENFADLKESTHKQRKHR